MAKGKTICNVCGQPFTDLDEQEHIGLHTKIGYGSRHDGDTIDLDICCSCFDSDGVDMETATKLLYEDLNERLSA